MTEEEKRKKNPYAVDGDAVYDRLRSDRPTYAATYEQPLADLYQRITTRPGFQYDVTADPLYQQYKGQYIQQGKLAMRDTMGQAAALTGGYGSTYGQQVGQQAYDAYLQKLGDVVPDLYSAAYGRYADEGDRLMQQYALLGQQRDDEYTRYRNELADWQDAENRNYSMQQQNYSNLYSLIGASGYTPTDEELAAAGMSREAANAIRMEYLRKNGLTDTAGGSGGGGGTGAAGGSGVDSPGGDGISGKNGLDYSTYRGVMQTVQYSTDIESDISKIPYDVWDSMSDEQYESLMNAINLRRLHNNQSGGRSGSVPPAVYETASGEASRQNNSSVDYKKKRIKGGGSVKATTR